MSGDGDPAGFGRMFELTVATTLSHLIPAIIMDEAQNVSRLHSFFPFSVSQR